MRATASGIAILALLSAAPAVAAPRDDAACVVGRLSPADIDAIVDETMAGGSTETLARIGGPLRSCAGGQDWTPRRGADAAAYTIGLVVRSTLRQRLAGQEIETAPLDLWFSRQSDEFRTTAFAGMEEAARDATIETLVGHEVPAELVERNGPMIGGYLSALMIMERIDRGLGM